LRDDEPLALGPVWREIQEREAEEWRVPPEPSMNGKFIASHQDLGKVLLAGPKTKASED
jgi:hypothetical protein